MIYMNDDKDTKPRIVVSLFLGFERCRYDGQTLKDVFVEKIKDYAEIVTVCAEVEIGLGVPRKAVRIADENGEYKLYQPSSGLDVTDKMNAFIKKYMENLGEIDGFILKNRSPTCGIN